MTGRLCEAGMRYGDAETTQGAFADGYHHGDSVHYKGPVWYYAARSFALCAFF